MSSFKLNEDMLSQEIIGRAGRYFGDRLGLLVSMQKTSGILIHMISRFAPATQVIFIDTGVHFKETLALKDEFEKKYGIVIRICKSSESFEEQERRLGYHAHIHDDERDPERQGFRYCCEHRKEIPLLRVIKGSLDALLGGLRRSSGGKRANIPLIEYDSRWHGYKINPLFRWTNEMVDDCIQKLEIPVHPLYSEGYSSIGCSVCTTPIRVGENERDGRWRHIREARGEAASLYCGINKSDT